MWILMLPRIMQLWESKTFELRRTFSLDKWELARGWYIIETREMSKVVHLTDKNLKEMQILFSLEDVIVTIGYT